MAFITSYVQFPPQRLLPLALALAGTHAAAQAPQSASTDSALPEVIISAPRAQPGRVQSFVGGLSDAPLAETPQSIGTISTDELKARGAQSLSSVMRFQTATSDSYNTIGYIESLSVRGFLLDNALNYRRDGMPVSNHSPLALENKERVETLFGVSGIQSGVSTPGGLVNYVLKRPTTTSLREIGLALSERGSVGLNGDFGGRSDDKTFGYRVNAALERRRPMADNAPGSRQFLSGFFDYRFANRDTLEVEIEQHRSKQISVPGFGLLDSDGEGIADTLPPVIRSRTNLNSQPWSQPFENTSTVGSIRYEHRLNDAWKIGARAGQQRIRTHDHLAFPDGCSTGPAYVYPGLCANHDVDIYDYRSDNERRQMSTGELYAKGRFQTGGIEHELNLAWRSTRYSERYEDKQAYNFVGTTNALNPGVLPGDGSKLDSNTLTSSRSRELSISDVLSFGPRWSVWLGVRHTQLNRASVRTDGSRATDYSQSFTTPWGGLGFKAWDGAFLYASAGEGVESEVVPNRPTLFTNAGQVLPALKSRQYEIGIKQVFAQANGQKGLLSASLFQIDKPFSDDVVLPGATLSTRVADGRHARHRGIELNYSGPLNRQWHASLSSSLIDARQTRDINNSFNGKRTTNVAPLSASAQLEWQFAPAWQWRNALTYFSSKPVTRDNAVKLPAGWQWDSSATVVQKSGSTTNTWRVGIDNVLNRRYWRDAPTQYWGGIYLFAAQERTFRVSVTSSF